MTSKIGRNALCPCGSNRKYKHCCLNKPVANQAPQNIQLKKLNTPLQSGFELPSIAELTRMEERTFKERYHFQLSGFEVEKLIQLSQLSISDEPLLEVGRLNNGRLSLLFRLPAEPRSLFTYERNARPKSNFWCETQIQEAFDQNRLYSYCDCGLGKDEVFCPHIVAALTLYGAWSGRSILWIGSLRLTSPYWTKFSTDLLRKGIPIAKLRWKLSFSAQPNPA